jgi:hypothetical protein
MARDPQAEAVGANLLALAAGAAKALTLEVAADLTAAAPVLTGHVRRNFVPSVGAPFEGEDDGNAQTQGQAAVLSYKIGDGDLFVTSNVDYLQYLILGSSSQAPASWDLVAVDKAQATIEQLYAGVDIDVTSSSEVSARGGIAARGLAAAYSPLGDDA